MAEKKHPRVMTLTGKREISTYVKDGEQHTIWGLDAVDADGNPIEGVDLRTFDDNIPLDEQREFMVQRYVHEKYGESFTVTVKREKLGPRVEQLESQVEELLAWKEDAEKRLAELEEPGF